MHRSLRTVQMSLLSHLTILSRYSGRHLPVRTTSCIASSALSFWDKFLQLEKMSTVLISLALLDRQTNRAEIKSFFRLILPGGSVRCCGMGKSKAFFKKATMEPVLKRNSIQMILTIG